MEERKAYFDLVSNKAVLLTEDELIEMSFNRYISLGEYNKFLYENEKTIIQDIDIIKNPKNEKMCYTIKSNQGAMSYNTYNNYSDAYTAAAANLYLEKRCKNGNI